MLAQRKSTRCAIVRPTCRHYVGPTYVKVNYNVGQTLALHNFNVGQTEIMYDANHFFASEERTDSKSSCEYNYIIYSFLI